MNWIRQLVQNRFGTTPGAAQHLVGRHGQELAKLRGHVAALPPGERAAYDRKVHEATVAQAAA